MMRPDVNMRWDATRGWLVFAPTALARPQLARIAAWARARQVERLHGLVVGERKDECKRTIEDLDNGRIACVVKDSPDGSIFASTERTRPERSFFYGTAAAASIAAGKDG